MAIRILVDGDSCPVKNETYTVAERYALSVKVVANSWFQVPRRGDVELVLVPKSGHLDVADDWIAERAGRGDIVVTADIPLAARCVEAGARVLSPRGRVFSEDSIGDALATRDLMADLREGGAVTGGPAPFSKRDRSEFLQRLDEIVNALRRQG